MAAVEVPAGSPPVTRLQSTISDLSGLSVDECIDTAREKLLFKDFNACILICETGITEAHMHSSQESLQKKIETLCILTIQAYAELNRWQQVIPFIQQVFGSVENCTYRVMQLCILLHSKIKEYTQCHALSSVWLKHPGNFSSDGYKDIVNVCITHILLPQDKVTLIPRYLESCPGLKPSEKQQLQKHYCSEHFHNSETKKSDGYDSQEDVMETSKNRHRKVEKNKAEIGSDNSLVKAAKAVVSKMKLYSLDTIMKVAVITLCLYLITCQGYNGETSYNRLSAFVKNIITALKSLFWPKLPS